MTLFPYWTREKKGERKRKGETASMAEVLSTISDSSANKEITFNLSSPINYIQSIITNVVIYNKPR